MQVLRKKEEKYIDNNIAYQSKGCKLYTPGSRVLHRLYRLKNDNMKSTEGQTNVSYDAIVA